MIGIFEKDGAVMVTFENITAEESSLIKRIEQLKEKEDRAEKNDNLFAKFKCNQQKVKDIEINPDDFEIIYDPNAELPF